MNTKELSRLLNEQLDLYRDFLSVQDEKHETIIRDDLKGLEEISVKEQIFMLKSRGLEQKREELLKKHGYSGKTLLEIVNFSEGEDKEKLLKLHKELLDILETTKEKNNRCQNLARVRIQRAQAVIDRLDQENSQKKQYFHDGSVTKQDPKKPSFISKKV